MCVNITPAVVSGELQRARDEVEQQLLELGVRSLERRAADAAAAAAAAAPPPLPADVVARLDNEALGPEDDVAPDDILDVTTRCRRDAAERAAGLGMDAVLKAAAINPSKETLEPQTDVNEPFVKGVGTVDAVLWRSAARSASASSACGTCCSGVCCSFLVFEVCHCISLAVLTAGALFCLLPAYALLLSADQLAALHAAAEPRPGCAPPRVAGGLSKAEMYIAVDGCKVHIRSVLATLCGRPRTSKDRVLRVQQQAVAILQPDEAADEPREDGE